jgi:hypothetical protein
LCKAGLSQQDFSRQFLKIEVSDRKLSALPARFKGMNRGPML